MGNDFYSIYTNTEVNVLGHYDKRVFRTNVMKIMLKVS